MKATHILDWRTVAPGAERKTLCGMAIGSEKTIQLGANDIKEGIVTHPSVANNPHDATCAKCRKKRDGR